MPGVVSAPPAAPRAAPSATAFPGPPMPGVVSPPPAPAVTAAPAALTPIPLTLPPPPAVAATPGVKPERAAGTPPARSPIVARLPTPPLSPEASPADFLRAARGALAAGRNGEARSALEMAQTRLLDRSVDARKPITPSHDLAVKQITEAIDALAANDRMTCLRYIEFASRTIGSPLN